MSARQVRLTGSVTAIHCRLIGLAADPLYIMASSSTTQGLNEWAWYTFSLAMARLSKNMGWDFHTEISLLYGVLASACIVTVTAFIWMTLPLANMPSNATTKGFATNLLADDANVICFLCKVLDVRMSGTDLRKLISNTSAFL